MTQFLRKKFEIKRTLEFIDWFQDQSLKVQLQVTKRLSKIQNEGYFGDHKSLEDDIWELKWKNGRRVYYCYITELKLLVLLGGNKNGQEKDIIASKRIFKKNINVKS